MGDSMVPMLSAIGAGIAGYFVGRRLAKRYVSVCSPASDSAILAAYYAMIEMFGPFVVAGLGAYSTRVLANYGFGYFSLYLGSLAVAYKLFELIST